MKRLLAASLAFGLLATSAHADGHDWLRDNKDDVKGAAGILWGAELCSLKTGEWRKSMMFKLGMWVGAHTTNEDNDEWRGMVADAVRITNNAYAAGGQGFCRHVSKSLPVLELKSELWDE